MTLGDGLSQNATVAQYQSNYATETNKQVRQENRIDILHHTKCQENEV